MTIDDQRAEIVREELIRSPLERELDPVHAVGGATGHGTWMAGQWNAAFSQRRLLREDWSLRQTETIMKRSTGQS